MIVAHTSEALAPFGGCILVPTMGALHEGHASLLRLAAEEAAASRAAPPPHVVATIFVNAPQFNDPADFERYPRTLDADLALCERAGADAVFAPAPHVVYPPGDPPAPPPLPPVAAEPGLEDRWRPGHFAGVCLVVRRLFELTRPGAAVFGEKDWQQLQAVRALTRADPRLAHIRIVPAPTIREADGLAMSSRNRLLAPDARRRAAAIPRALRAACDHRDPAAAEGAMRAQLEAAGLEAQYAAVRDAATLRPLSPPRADAPPAQRAPARALIAAICGNVRLIDNCPWPA